MKRTTSQNVVEKSGWICLVAGVLGAGAALLLVLVDPVVQEGRYSYPLSPEGFMAIQVFFFVHHFGLITGLYGMRRSGVAGTSRLGRWGTWGAIAGMGLLTVAELVAISGANSAYPSPRTDMIDSLYGLASILIGTTLIMAGIGVVRAGVWRGRQRVLPLVLGIYVFVPMTPAIFGPFMLARLAIGGWMLLFALLGWALIKEGHEALSRPGANAQRPIQEAV